MNLSLKILVAFELRHDADPALNSKGSGELADVNCQLAHDVHGLSRGLASYLDVTRCVQ